MGVDVSKSSLDNYRPDRKEFFKIENAEDAIEQFCSNLSKLKDQIVFIMEATGGYEYALLRVLEKHQFKAAVVNPRRVRDFAKGIGKDAKTDAIDAKVLSRFGEVVTPIPMATTSDHERKHSALVARRNQLLELISQENNRLKQSWDDDAKKSIRECYHIDLKTAANELSQNLSDQSPLKSSNPE